MLPKPMTLALGAVAAVIGWAVWENTRPTGDKAKAGDVVGVDPSALGADFAALAAGQVLPMRVQQASTDGAALYGVPRDFALMGVAASFPRASVRWIERDGRRFT
jgi:hypothetical protein